MDNICVREIVYNRCRKIAYPAIAKVEPSWFDCKELICEVLWKLRIVEMKGKNSLYNVVYKIKTA